MELINDAYRGTQGSLVGASWMYLIIGTYGCLQNHFEVWISIISITSVLVVLSVFLIPVGLCTPKYVEQDTMGPMS